MNKKLSIYAGIIVIFFSYFFGAFKMYYFSDDFKFLAASRQFDVLSFFSPIRTTFYRPLPTEFFYFFLQRFPFPMITGHIFVFAVFLLGVYFLYKTILLITKNKELSLSGDSFLSYYFPNRYDLKVMYEYKERNIPTGSCIVTTSQLMKN